MKRPHDGRNRRSIRLEGYDYRDPGAYFVTVCTHARDHVFGIIADEEMMLNGAGDLLTRIWARTVNDERMPSPHDFVVMPNHVHGIVWLPRSAEVDGSRGVVGARHPPIRDDVPTANGIADRTHHSALVVASPLQHADGALGFGICVAGSLGAVVGSFKSVSARAINRLRGTPGLAVWQRGYYERIVRGDGELGRIRQYILDNPMRWGDDPNNEDAVRLKNSFERA